MSKTYDGLAKSFIMSKGYGKEEFKDVDVSNDLEAEVSEFVDSIKGSLDNYEDYEFEYKNGVYEKVCEILDIA